MICISSFHQQAAIKNTCKSKTANMQFKCDIKESKMEKTVPKFGSDEDDEVVLVDVEKQMKRMKLSLGLNFPKFILTITSIQWTMFVLSLTDWNRQQNFCWIQTKFGYDPWQRSDLYRLLSYGLIHLSIYRLVGNVSIQLLIGIPLEILSSSMTIVKIYVCGILGGSLAIGAFDQTTYAFGASAGIYALKMAWFAFAILNWASLTLFHFFVLIFLPIYIIVEKIFLEEPEISMVGDIGGAFIGLLASFYFLKPKEDKAWKRILGLVSILAVFSFGFAVLILNNSLLFDIPEGPVYKIECPEEMMKYSFDMIMDEKQNNLTSVDLKSLNLTNDEIFTESLEYYSDESMLHNDLTNYAN